MRDTSVFCLASLQLILAIMDRLLTWKPRKLIEIFLLRIFWFPSQTTGKLLKYAMASFSYSCYCNFHQTFTIQPTASVV
jgi:hypothetical protein